MDLHVQPGPGVPGGLTVPDTELVERFSRSPGPGGQSVNTTDSRVELRYDVASSPSLREAQRQRVLRNLRGRLVGGTLVVTASEHRSQHRNRLAARKRMAGLLRQALAPAPPSRRSTKPTRASQKRRVAEKRRRGETKALRSRIRDD